MRTWLWRRLYLHVIDHGFLRFFYSNLHRLPGGLYRSNQPSPAKLRALHRKLGLRTVINLRGGDYDNPAWQLEKQTCDQLGITLIDLRLFSRSFPYVDDVHRVKEVVLNAEYPALVHCKSGADRAGLFSVFYRIFKLGEPVESASKELSLRYGHLKWARTGTLDQFFSEFLKDRRCIGRHLRLEEWVTSAYDRDFLKSTRPERGIRSRVADFVVNRILRRE